MELQEQNGVLELTKVYSKLSFTKLGFVPKLLLPAQYKSLGALFVINFIIQDGLIKTSAIDVRLVFESSENFLQQTTVFCINTTWFTGRVVTTV